MLGGNRASFGSAKDLARSRVFPSPFAANPRRHDGYVFQEDFCMSYGATKDIKSVLKITYTISNATFSWIMFVGIAVLRFSKPSLTGSLCAEKTARSARSSHCFPCIYLEFGVD